MGVPSCYNGRREGDGKGERVRTSRNFHSGQVMQCNNAFGTFHDNDLDKNNF